MMQDSRRDPDAFLALYREEQARQKEGRLKIFFGYAPGVGKTYAMLEDARKLLNEGVDVVIGIVETHGREATKALLGDMETITPRLIEYKGATLNELDIDAILERKPQIVLVDEAAHTNAPGSRHEKRWQDINELLANGIDVFTTLNTQHVETLNDRVAQITSIEVRERVPDSFIEEAFEIELVDLPVDELMQRLRDGKVYIQEQASTALEHFFRKGNLIALREIALLFVAQRVDAQMKRYREAHRIASVWPAAERILVCVSPSPLSVKLVRGAKRMATALRAEWLVAYVQTPKQAHLSDADRARVIQTMRLAEQLGAEIIELTGDNVADELIGCARKNNVSKIIVGKPALPRWREILFGSVVDDTIRKSGAIDVYVITGEEGMPSQAVAFNWKRTTKNSHYWTATFVVAGCSGLAYLLSHYLEPTNLVMIYLLGVFFVALRLGRGPSILASILSVAVFDYCFVPPFLTFAVSDSQYVLTFFVMLMVALSISTLAARVRQQAEFSSLKERRTAALYSLSKELASTDDPIKLLKIGADHLADVFSAKVSILTPDEHGQLAAPVAVAGERELEISDLAFAQWVFHNRQMAGVGTNTLPGADALYLPLAATERTIGVVGIKPDELESFSRPEQIQLLQTFVNQLAQACERAYLSEENKRAQVQMKTEQLRSSLLSSVSHDLRTPLATITGAASSIIEAPESLSIEACKERASEIFHESVRLNRLVMNLLEMTRLQAGSLIVKREWCPVDEIVGSAVSCMDDKLGNRKLEIEIADPTMLVPVDATLVQQVLVNLLDNAIKYSPVDTPLAITASRSGENLMISVSDHGPGIPIEHRKLIFEKFYRENPGESFGAGLGLAICAGIVEAHGGEIWVEENPVGGSVFRISLPMESIDLPMLDPLRLTERSL
jgi:two-component system sensor histidine kinase KdpD